MSEPRPACPRCRRPVGVCWCQGLEPVSTRTHVAFLQHVRESRRRLSTCRMAHLGLAGSEHIVGAHFDEHPRVRALAATPGTAVLFPSENAAPPECVRPTTLLVVDGTWSEARKVVARSEVLRGLPRVGLVPAAPGRYRIRREPAPHCLATVEAVVQVLTALEGDAQRFDGLLAAFERLVSRQLDARERAPRPWQHAPRVRPGTIRPAARVAATLRTLAADLVLLHAEASPQPGGAELVQLVAVHPASGARFATLVAPVSAPDPRTLVNLGLDAAALASAPDVATALARWRAFRGPTGVVAGWGGFAPWLLARYGQAADGTIDLRALAARARGGRSGGVEATAALLGVPVRPCWAPGRGGRRAAALAAVAAGLAAAAD